MRSLIAIAAVVASFSASAGDLDGKGIKCVLVDWIDPILVSFQDGVATHFVLSMRDTKALIEVDTFGGGEYTVFPSKVEWPHSLSDDGMVLDRTTLMLGYVNYGELRNAGQCEVYTSLSDFEAMMEAWRVQKQAEIDEEMRGNKI